MMLLMALLALMRNTTMATTMTMTMMMEEGEVFVVKLLNILSRVKNMNKHAQNYSGNIT